MIIERSNDVMTDKLKTEVKLKPIRVPDYIIADVQQETKFHVSELSHETLNGFTGQA